MSGFSQFLAFACAARHGSFAGAGRELGVTPSTVAKRIMRLEEQLGLKLFHRTTRQVTLTSDGESLYARCEKILADIDELETLAAGASGSPRGELRVSVPITYGKLVVLPALARLLRAHPEMTADVRLSDQFCDLIKDGFDAAIRVGTLADSGLASRQIDVQQLRMYASPGYLDAHGVPKHPSRLDGHRFILFRNPTSGRERHVQFQVNGKTMDVQPQRRLLVNDGEGMVNGACLGLGLLQVPDFMAADAVARGALVEVLPGFQPPPQPMNVVWAGNRLIPPRLRAFIDALARQRDDRIQEKRAAKRRADASGSSAM
ncbi:MAG: LysR family transcriptional regulator [Bacillota bacterium]